MLNPITCKPEQEDLLERYCAVDIALWLTIENPWGEQAAGGIYTGKKNVQVVRYYLFTLSMRAAHNPF